MHFLANFVYTFPIIFFAFVRHSSHSQPVNTEKDLILQIQSSKSDSAIFKSLDELIDYYENANFFKAKPYILRSINVAESLSNAKKADALINLSSYYLYFDQYDSALHYIDLAYQIYESLEDKKGIGKTFNYRGRIYQDQTDYIKALEMHKKSIGYYREISDVKNMAIAYINLGLAEYGMSNYDKATEYYIASLGILDSLNSPKLQWLKPYTYKGMGMMYLKMGDIDESLIYFKKME